MPVEAIELILPDVHLQHLIAQRIISSVPHTHLTLLGDYFDDFYDNPAQAAATAQWLATLLDAHPAAEGYLTALTGNHDLPYRFPNNGALECSGWTAAKSFAIRSHMHDRHWGRLGAYRRTQGWLLSHAGFHPTLLATAKAFPSPANESKAWKAAETGSWHPWFAVGRDRGGFDSFGGPFWCDWSQLPATPGVKQIVGHSRGGAVRYNSGGGGVEGMAKTRYCLDTHLAHYGVLQSGELQVGAVADLPA